MSDERCNMSGSLSVSGFRRFQNLPTNAIPPPPTGSTHGTAARATEWRWLVSADGDAEEDATGINTPSVAMATPPTCPKASRETMMVLSTN